MPPRDPHDLPGSGGLAEPAHDRGADRRRAAARQRPRPGQRSSTTAWPTCCKQVGLEPAWRERYPHAFSGGQRQRIGIARAIALNPRVIVADEATSALDVSLRSQMLDLMMNLQDKLGLSYVFISHDIGVIRYMCDRVAVMYRGQVVETG